LVKQLAAMPDRMKAKAEACVYLGKDVIRVIFLLLSDFGMLRQRNLVCIWFSLIKLFFFPLLFTSFLSLSLPFSL